MEQAEHLFTKSEKEESSSISSNFVETLCEQGSAMLEAKKYDEAIEVFSKAIEIDPKCFEAYEKRALSKLGLKHNQEALEDIILSISLNPKNAKLYYELAEIQIEMISSNTDNNEALQNIFESLQQAVSLNPKFLEAYLLRANICRLVKDYPHAIMDYKKIVELAPTADNFFHSAQVKLEANDFGGGFDDITKAIELAPAADWYLYERGMLNLALKKLPEAITDFTKAIKLNPENTEALGGLMTCYNDSSNYLEAIETYDKLIDESKKEISLIIPNIYVLLGNVHLRLKNYEKAVEDFSQALTIDNPSSEVYLKRGMCYFELGKYLKAINDCNEAIKLENNNAAAYFLRSAAKLMMGAIANALNDSNVAIDLDPTNADFYNQRAEIYIKLNDKEAALKDFSQSVKLHPTLDSLNNLALSYLQLFDYTNAFKTLDNLIADFKEELKAQNLLADIYHNRGLSCKGLGKNEEAIEDFSAEISLDKKRAHAYARRAECYFQLNKFEDALNDCDTAIQLDNKILETYLIRASLLLLSNKHQEAIADLNKAIELDPIAEEAYYFRGRVRLLCQDYKDADEDFIKVLQLNPQFSAKPELLKVHAEVKLNLNQYQEALELSTQALKLRPDVPENWFCRAEARLALRQYQEAINDFSKALEFFTESEHKEVAYLKIGEAFQAIGNYKKAEEYFTKVIELNYSNAQAYGNRAIVRKELKNYEAAMDDAKHAMKDPQLYQAAKILIGEIEGILQEQKRQAEAAAKVEEIKKPEIKVYSNNPPVVIFPNPSASRKPVQKDEQEPLLQKESEEKRNKDDSCCTLI